MSFKILPRVPTIENFKYIGYRKDSEVSSGWEIGLKSFSNNNILQNLMASFRPDSPLTKHALNILGIKSQEITKFKEELLEKGASLKSKPVFPSLRLETQNLKMIKTLKEIFKKRKEIKTGGAVEVNAPIDLKDKIESPRKIKVYFRKRFFSPQQDSRKRDEKIDEICRIDSSIAEFRERDRSFEIKNQKKIDFYRMIEKKQDNDRYKREQINERLEKLKEEKRKYWQNQAKMNESLRGKKVAFLSKMHQDFNNSLKLLDNSLQAKEMKIEELRKQQENMKMEKIKEFRNKEELRKEKVDIYQLQEEERIRDDGDFILNRYEQKLLVCEEKLKQYQKCKARSLEKRAILAPEKRTIPDQSYDEMPRKVRIIRRIGILSHSLENAKRMKKNREKEKQKTEENLERSMEKENKVEKNLHKKEDERMVKFEKVRLRREENETSYQRNKRAKRFLADVYLDKICKRDQKIKVLKEFREFLVQCK